MAKNTSTKSKLLIIAQLLIRRSDEEHVVTMQDIINELNQYGIVAERKSIYRDFDTLKDFGLDIQLQKRPNSGWFIGSRDFQLPELKLLVDAVQSSRFLTKRKSDDLIRKLEGLASVHQARQLQRQVYVDRRIKTMNESIFYNLDSLQTAVSECKKITFKYFEYSPRKEKMYRRNGFPYHLSPYGLIYDSENYYVVGLDEDRRDVRHYRVDKMSDILVTDEQAPRNLAWDPEGYTNRHFGMFAGQECALQLRCKNHFAGVLLDRFGRNIIMVPERNGEYFTVTLDVVVSPAFWGWLFGLEDGVQILGPQWAIDAYAGQMQHMLELYRSSAVAGQAADSAEPALASASRGISGSAGVPTAAADAPGLQGMPNR